MRQQTRITSAIFAAIPAFILGAATLCAYAIAQGAPSGWRVAFRLLCHGRPERSFEIFGTAMPICARCTAIYAGMLVGVIAFVAVPLLRRVALPGSVAIACVVPMVLDGLSQGTGLRESTNALRTVTGFLAATGPMLWVMAKIEKPGETQPATEFSKS